MRAQDYIWYASYGSNISRARLLCYIKGGVPEESQKGHTGCRDNSEPLKDKNLVIHRDLYFAKKSKAWNGGGVCFIGTEPNLKAETLGRMYLITKEQFTDLVKQEIDYNGMLNIDFDKAIAKGNLIVKPDAWYGNIIYLGQENNSPIFTFTNEKKLEETNPPDESYLKTIIKGLKETYTISSKELEMYLSSKPGIKGHYIANRLRRIIEGE